MLKDSGHIHEYDVKYVNKNGQKKDFPRWSAVHTMAMPPGRRHYFEKSDRERVSTYSGCDGSVHGCRSYPGIGSGHAGSGRRWPETRLWFSGDIGRPDKPLLRDPVFPTGYKADHLLMECTYGDRPHDDISRAVEELKEVVARTIKRGGKVIIPAFFRRADPRLWCIT